MQSIRSTNYFAHFQDEAYRSLGNYLNENSHSKVFILVDTNTEKYCLPGFLESAQFNLNYEVIQIKAGEEFKHIETCNYLWNTLSEKGADRKSLMINLGGGVITDMGGFVASTFKRGIKFINIPTTLLSMVDASVGGKTGVDLGVLKNQIGLFSNPEMVLVDMNFLKTVTDREMRSGLAEIIKYGFTFDKQLWDTIQQFTKIDLEKINDLVYRSVEIKNDVVLKDLLENDLRKSLNFGHTIGHAIESYFLESEDKQNLTHGEAIAAGMVIELYYSSKVFNFPFSLTESLRSFVLDFYGPVNLKKEDFSAIMDLMKFDKKNVSGKVNFVLLDTIENCKLDIQLSPELIEEGLLYYKHGNA
ncbi:3-dehydroquinate synthase [Lutimonas zeaxanthinifaciens]|uniref:3-dehydroquinate synthase n=1 Tax=Lutimonas zeaxanthinifaciens TaxID=3060215 RepID=UPI00265D58B6|nr:3-dehydroquinate synthase [Lutimonas sp. YSD2104]WKK64735.1 3-dehydroquinate synthase [Lutimonas sp. YSD2104]